MPNWIEEAKHQAQSLLAQESKKIAEREQDETRRKQEIKQTLYQIAGNTKQEIDRLLKADVQQGLEIRELGVGGYCLERYATNPTLYWDWYGHPDSPGNLHFCYCWIISEKTRGEQLEILLGVVSKRRLVKKGHFFNGYKDEFEMVLCPSTTALEVEVKIKNWLVEIYSKK